ncbi:phospho-acceptor domain-containing protein [Mucilaginibacter frigoritolerans]|uniref:histidine kinase n=1 Tax=Mucilaginibacter frigoritolerans TaxID=652788 RepID=A0A562TYV1_9SPHI|nr:HAMP domain-containing sensor histidine kinase [Mucilaginibacter frigoritolerans]TWI98643.1 phospho-acceptor domain-containing protein [Mucilaginibacter frigoritolerans]
MKKRLSFLLFIAALTAGGIILFQCYWVYNTYKAGEQNLNRLLLNALQKSVENYHVQQSDLPATLKLPSPYLSVLETSPVDTDKTLKVVFGDIKHTPSIAKIEQVPVNPENLQRVKAMLAATQFMSATLMNNTQLNTLKAIFKNELGRNNIELPFNLVLLKPEQKLPHNKIAAYINYAKNSPIVEAVFSNKGQMLLVQNIVPAVISLILIMLSAGSLCYMWIIIRRQMRLDDIKNDFISNITHELRTPISILKSTNEALSRYGGIGEPEKAERYLKINTVILDKLDHNVDRILDITRYESGDKLARPIEVNINEIIYAGIEKFTLDGKNNIEFLNPSAIKEVLTDSYMIDTIISNLVDNAIKYGGENVKVTITINSFEKGWELTITDDGPGIDQKYLPFIFDKFYRVPSGNLHEVKGYGLGLSYVKQLVASLNGIISVKSMPNSGTTFTIKFPER